MESVPSKSPKIDSVTVTLFHPVALVDGKYFLKPHHGAFLDDLSSYFEDIRLAVPFARPAEFPQWMTDGEGRLTYNYELKAKNVRIFLFPFAFSPWARCKSYWRALRGSSHVFFFSPSLISAIGGGCFWIARRPFYAYVSTDPELFYQERFGSRWGGLGKLLAMALGKFQVFVLGKAAGLLVTGAKNQQLFGGRTRAELVSPLMAPVQRAKESVIVRKGHHFVFVGVITPRKKVLETISLVGKMRSLGVPATLDIVGTTDDKFREYFDRVMAAVSGSSGFVRYLGFVGDQEKLRSIYVEADFLVLISEFEGFPKVVYEAMEMGCIPLLSELPSYKGILVEGKNCLYWRAESATKEEGLVKEILALSPKRREAIQSANGDFVRRRRERSAAWQLAQMIRTDGATIRANT